MCQIVNRVAVIRPFKNSVASNKHTVDLSLTRIISCFKTVFSSLLLALFFRENMLLILERSYIYCNLKVNSYYKAIIGFIFSFVNYDSQR